MAFADPIPQEMDLPLCCQAQSVWTRASVITSQFYRATPLTRFMVQAPSATAWAALNRSRLYPCTASDHMHGHLCACYGIVATLAIPACETLCVCLPRCLPAQRR